jgi:hypothetical protein
MNRKQCLVVIGAMGLLVGGSECTGKSQREPNASAFDTSGGGDTSSGGIRRHTVEGFLSDTGRTKAFDSALVVSLCQLEGKAKSLDLTKRICPTGNPKDVKIPTYPPYPPK